MEALAEKILTEFLRQMKVSFSGVEKQSVAGQTVFSVQADDTVSLIGQHGDTVYAIDTLVKKMVEHAAKGSGTETEEPLFLVDVGGYRAQKLKEIETKALMMADRARAFQYDVELSPMSAYERLIVHTVLDGQPNIKTESQGEGRNRRVVIKYAA